MFTYVVIVHMYRLRAIIPCSFHTVGIRITEQFTITARTLILLNTGTEPPSLKFVRKLWAQNTLSTVQLHADVGTDGLQLLVTVRIQVVRP